jgi:hypothetical protein
MSFTDRRRVLWMMFLIGLVLLALTAMAARSTTLVTMPLDELARRSTAVARLRCLGSRSLWERGELWTETRFEVLEQTKGSLPEFVTVHTLGGRDGRLHSRVEGVPIFHSGEQTYLFLWAHKGEPYRVLGWSQGTFRIKRDARTGVETVTQDSAAMPVFETSSRSFRREGIRNLRLEIFQGRLRRALEKNQ